MSSYRKVRSSHSIYHPGISLSHEPTYNQKKGMILTRSTNLPQPVHKVVTVQSLRDDARQAVKSGYVKFKTLTLKFTVDHDLNSYTMDEDNISQFLIEKLGPSTNILAANVTQFAFVRHYVNTAWPDVNYTLNIDDASLSVTTLHPSSAAGLGGLYTAVFTTPNYTYNSSYASQSYLYCPRFETYNNTLGYARVNYSAWGGASTVSQDFKDKLAVLNSAGYSEIPYCSFGGIYPYPISTVLTFDASGVSEQETINLELSCDVYYIK